MPNIDSPWNVDSPWDGSAAIKITVDQVLQSILAGALLFTAVALLIGIIEALRHKWWKRPRYVRLGVYSTICTIVLATVLLSIYPLGNVSPSYLSMLLYVLVILLAELIPIIMFDGVRNAFIGETPLLSDILKHLEKRPVTEKGVMRFGGSASPGLGTTWRNQGVYEAGYSNASPIPVSSAEIRQEPIGSPTRRGGGEAGLRSSDVRQRVMIDPDYERYRRWTLDNGLFLWELDYRKFAKIREVVNQVLEGSLFGMSGSRLDIAALCLLARIDAKEDVEKLRRSNRKAYEKLRRFKLVSDRGRLMPRGVRLVKALKKEGLIEKLREHPL